MSTNKKKEVYILMTCTGTVPSKLIKFFTKKPYTHVSISLDKELHQLYSFGRKKLYMPLLAGFIKEDIQTGVYSLYKNTTCRVIKINVSQKQYKKLCDNIKIFQKKPSTHYNFLGLLGVLFGRPIRRKNAYFCSEFVANILMNSGIFLLDKNPSLVEPSDFLTCNNSTFVFEGLLQQFTPYPA